jgi:TfoX/Sxy family transcriptional regulator of competence genes
MAYNEALAARVRSALAKVPRVEERRMFGGVAFMVNGKMCVTVGRDRLLCRIDPELHESATRRKGARTVKMKGRDYIGYVYVNEEALKSKSQFDYWLGLALDFNERAKSSRPRKKK